MDLRELVTGSDARGGAESVLDQRLRALRGIERLDKPSVVTMFGY